MPNQVTPTGIETLTQAELVAQYTAAFQAIYGADINLAQDTPDGQMMMIFIQSVLDLEDLITQVYNGFDPDNAIGVVLDQRVAINGIQRKGGTYSVTNVTLVTTQSLNLYGLDQGAQPIYTVQDNAGNQWQLLSTTLGLAAGTHALAFRSAVPGAVLTTPNTITIPVTIILGVDSINNPTAATSTGINEESDAALKIRRQQSVAQASQGYLAGLLAALLNINDVDFAQVYENVTGSTDGDGVPSHSIWVIVGGSATDADIANAIYRKRNAGCGMFGAQSYNVVRPDGSSFTVNWDEVVPEALFIKFTATSLDGINPPNIAAIRSGLVLSFVPGVFEEVNVNALATAVQAIDPNTLVTSAGFSTTSGGSYTNTLTPAAKNKQFAVTSPDIIILAIIVNPTSASVANTVGTVDFTALGGFGAYTWTIHTNNSGGTINGSTGHYVAGSTPSTDTVRATDAAGNFKDVSVVVT